jgi:organic radical activating enzyme
MISLPSIIFPTIPGEKIVIPKVEFYITNVCNLTCQRCNRFNDYNFKGWQRWSDFEKIYEAWADKIEINQIVILGGEPLLNPTINEWVTGLNRLWNKTVQILSNGTRLNLTPGLYEVINRQVTAGGPKNWIGVSLHNRNELDWYLNEVRAFLKGNIEFREDKTQLNDQGNSWTDGADYWFCDENGVKVLLHWSDSLYNAAVHAGKNGRLTLYNNDVRLTHQACGFAQFKCYHFIKGALYKCGPVALFPDFDQQHNLDLSDEDRKLINSYQPLTIDDFDQRAHEFLSTIDEPIPQCKFCWATSDLKQEQIFAVRKGNSGTSISNAG